MTNNVVQMEQFARTMKRPWECDTLEEAVDLVLGLEMKDSVRIVYLSLLRRWWKSRGSDFYERVTGARPAEIAKSCGESEATVRKALSELQEAGFLLLSKAGDKAFAMEVPLRICRAQERDSHTTERPMFAAIARNEFLPPEERTSMDQMDEETADHIKSILNNKKKADMFCRVARAHGITVNIVVNGESDANK